MQVASYSPAPAVRNSQVSHNRSVSIAASVLLAKPGSTSETPTRPALRHNRSLTQPPPGSAAAWQLAAAPPPGHEAAVNAQSSRPRPFPAESFTAGSLCGRARRCPAAQLHQDPGGTSVGEWVWPPSSVSSPVLTSCDAATTPSPGHWSRPQSFT